MDNENDIKLPSNTPTGDGDFESTTVMEVFKKCKEKYESFALPYLTKAQFNERMIAGEQFIDLVLSRISDVDWPSSIPRVNRNLLSNLSLTWSARIIEDRPNVACFPSEVGADEFKAQAASKVLEYERQQKDFDDLCFSAADYVQSHSCVGFKVVWDPLKGPKSKGVPRYDQNGLPVVGPDGKVVLDRAGESLGEVSWNVVSVFDYATDGAEFVEDSQWCYFQKMIDENEARRLLLSAGVTEEPKTDENVDIWGTSKEGVMLYELWIRPGHFEFPKGLFAVIVGDTPIMAIDYPYEHGELPLLVWKCRKRRNSPFGCTHVDDAVPIQKLINDTVAACNVQSRQISGIKLLAHSTIISKIAEGGQMIPVDSKEIAEFCRYLEPPDRARVLSSTLTDATEALYSVYGLNEMLTGAEPMKSGTAAKSIAYLNKLDSMKMSGAARNLGKAILGVMRQTLKLNQQFVQVERLAQIIGTNNLMVPMMFKGADIAGVDVRLEPIAGLELYRAAAVEEANGQMQTMGATPQLVNQAQTGLRNTADDSNQRQMLQTQVQSVLQGQQVQADTTIDPNVAVDEIVKMLSDNYGTPNGQGLLQLLMQYRQISDQAMQQQVPQNAQPQV